MKQSRWLQRNRGFSLTEMVVTALMLGFSIAAVGEVCVMNTFATTKMTNKADGLSAARTTIERISRDIRGARAFGDMYASPIDNDENQFPSKNNFLYATTPPTGGWPGAPWPGTPYVLSPSCLVIQQPVFFLDPANDPSSPSYNASMPQNPRNGFPMLVHQGAVSGKPIQSVENLDTIVYQVVPDPNQLGQFLLQMARFPGAQLAAQPPETVTSSYSVPINPPQTILKGLVGPKDPAAVGNTSALPNVFRYYSVSTSPPSMLPTGSLTASAVPLIRGVAIDLEITRPDATDTAQKGGANPQTLGVHSEAFLRSNANIVLSNY